VTEPCESEKRQFVRIPVDLRIDYRFIRQPTSPGSDAVLAGHSGNIGAGGLLLVGQIPENDLIADLLMRRVIVALDIHLPGAEQPIRALSRVAWLEAIDPDRNACAMGLTFKEITVEAQDELFRFIINSVAP